MRTLYISDLDGTLLQPNVELSEETVTILNELIGQGMIFSVATARTIASVRPILSNVNINMPIILMNGVCIYDLDKKDYIKIETLGESSVRILMSVIKRYELKGFVYAIKDGVMSTYYEDLNSKPLHDFYQERVDKYRKPFIQVDDFSSLAPENLIYFSLMDTREKLEDTFHILEGIPDINCTFYKDNYTPDIWYLEVFSKNASKYHALEYLRTYLGVDTVVCFGDNRNDLPLFLASDHKYAVANAVPELMEKADAVIGSNTDNGVARWLKKNVIL